jgi:uncharacterized membrane protein YhaH (DUF805 family)
MDQADKNRCNNIQNNKKMKNILLTIMDEKPRMFQNPFSFYGRIRRLEYGLSIFKLYFYSSIIGLIIGFSGIPVALMYLFLLPVYWFQLAQGAKRCHDKNNSGWYQIIPFYGL